MDAPDLSHLTEQERMIIEKVMARQKEEEEKEKEVFKKKQDEVRLLETAIRMRSEELQRKEGGATDLQVTCQICLKTKFADGVGHVCHYCAIRCCARCGGKVSLRTSKQVIWVCILCRKKQELVIKTGQWVQSSFNKGGSEPKLERARSLDKETTGSPLSRRASLQRQSSHPTSTTGYRRQLSQESNAELDPSSSRRYFWDEETRQQQQASILRTESSEDRRYHQHAHHYPHHHQETHDGSSRRSRSPSVGGAERERSRSRHREEGRHHRRSPSGQRGDRRSPREDQYPPPRSPPPHFRSSPYYEEGGRDGSGGAPWPGDSSRRAAGEPPRTDSLSSDQSEHLRPGHHQRPRRTHHHQPTRDHGKRGPHLQRSFSSSEDEVRSTPDYSSCEDSGPDSLSERGDEKRSLSSRVEQKRSEAKEDAKHFLFSQPVSWKQSSDGKRMIGHMILKKGPLDAHGLHQGLGMRVVGGRILESGRLGAVVENTKKGGIADLVGRIRPGDEVVEWNGRCLQDKTYDEVYDIIAESKQEPQIELIVCRQISGVLRSESLDYRRTSHLEIHPEVMTREGNPRYRRTSSANSPRSPEGGMRLRSPTVGGRIQVKLWYEAKHLQLVVTILRAVELPSRPNLHPRNPYVKILLLPDRSEKSKRRTKTIASSNEPKWNQSFIYAPLRRSDLRHRRLEISLWDYDRYAANDFLGEVVIELGTAPLDDEPEWHLLTSHEDSLSSRLRRQTLYEGAADPLNSVGPTDRLSPPSTSSRLSDSELSEDYEDRFSTQAERRMMAVDGASISSSLGSSSSPPFLMEDAITSRERRSRREVSAPYGGRLDEAGTGTDSSQYIRSRRDTPGDMLMVRGRSRSVVPGTPRSPSRRANDSSSRSLSPPELRPRSPALSSRHPYPSSSLLPSSSLSSGVRRMPSSAAAVAFKKRQLPQIPPFGSSTSSSSIRFGAAGHHQTMSRMLDHHPTSDLSRATPTQHYHHRYDAQLPEGLPMGYSSEGLLDGKRYEPRSRRGGGSRMAAALGVAVNSPLEGAGGPVLDRSDSDSSSKYSITSAFGSTQLHKSSRTLSEFTTRMQHSYGPVHPSHSEEKTDGSLSDTALPSSESRIESRHRQLGGGSTGTIIMDQQQMRSGGKGNKVTLFMGLNKRSSSASQLSVTGNKKRLGFRRKPTTSLIVQRSEEVLPEDVLKLSAGGGSSLSSDGEGSLSGDSLTWVPALRITDDGEMSTFVEGLGPGQLVGRQALASPSLGEVQLSLCERKSKLEVEVIRARGLQPKQNAKILPAPYVKVYLLSGRKCLAKAKTSTARRTLDPLYQEQLVFHEDFRNCCLQVTVWGDYSRMEKKVFMGVAQIMLDDLDLSNLVIGWYKLFHHSSLINVPSVGTSTRNSSLLSLDSFG